MTKFLNAFLEFKNEANATRKFALFAVVIITLGLISLSVTGIVATAHWTVLSFLPIIGLILAVIGAELMSTVAFVRALAAPTLKRKIAGYVISLGLAWVGVHNAENGVRVVWPDRFAESSSSLSMKAQLAGEEAATLKAAQDTAIGGTGAELERVRTQIADLKTEQQLMTSMSPEGISRAQKSLIAQGLYFGTVDGISENKTESAMRARGEAITRELATLKAREDGLMQGQASPVQQANTDTRLKQIDLLAMAETAFWAAVWLAVMLWTLEGCRSLGLWALVTDVTGSDVARDKEREAELAELRHQNELAALAALRTPPPAPPPEVAPAAAPEPAIPEPIAAEAPAEPELDLGPPLPPEPPAPEPEPEFTDAQKWGREGAKQAQINREAERARQAQVFVIGPESTVDEAMKVAAQ